LGSELREVPGFWAALAREVSLEQSPDDDPLLELERAGFVPQVARLREFLAKFGDRAFEELKIECLTFRQDPRGFLRLLRFMGDGAGSAGAPANHAPRPARLGELRGLMAWIRGF